MNRSASSYIGRFAPSPTGPLHMGSLVAALASYLDAKFNRGKWLLRVDDIDPPREQGGASQIILKSLHSHGMHWDDDVLYQSHRHYAYDFALNELNKQHQLYLCTCSRRQLSSHGPVYPGYCRERTEPPEEAAALRIKVDKRHIQFQDLIQGKQHSRLSITQGDFILKRKDGLYAYQLATAVDDDYQQITHVVRGADLLDSTSKQIYLQQLLGYDTPQYTHIPVLVDSNKEKLSKQRLAPALVEADVCKNLLSALQQLNQPLPPISLRRTSSELLNWSIEHWQLNQLPNKKEILYAQEH